jgi:[ribosomal protein S18]-alanine N-acetyltransferase
MQSNIGKSLECSHVDKEIEIRPLNKEDSGALASLETKCPEAAQWGEQGYQGIGHNGLLGWGAVRAAVFTGFILVRVVADELEVLNLAVEPPERRQGIASRLLNEAISQGRGLAAKRAYLEVRESNSAARDFYSTHEFTETNRRKAYYSQPLEDAIVLVRQIR